MGSCLDASSKIDAAQSSRTSGITKTSPSSLSIHSYSEQSNFSTLPAPITEEETLSSPNLKSFTFNELKNATRNFGGDCLIAEGRFGYVYKGDLGSGIVVAVRKLEPEVFQDHKEWLTEVNYLGQLHHRNLVKLFGYCLEGENRLLVYEFMPNGSLENHLFSKGPQPLSWSVRMKVAIGAAKGLAFLHNAQSQVIYRGFKASNILLDAEFNAKLSDFGFAKAGHVSTPFMDVHGLTNVAPEYTTYIAAGLYGEWTDKTNVYSFGIVLLELLSGRCADEDADIKYNLMECARRHLVSEREVSLIMDPKLMGQYPEKGAYTAHILSVRCLNLVANARPSMTEVLATLEHIEGPPRVAGKHSQRDPS